MSHEYTVVKVEAANRVGVITMNRPRQLNAINGALMDELTHAMGALTEDGNVDVIVLAAEGRAFSAGFDLKESAAKNYTTVPQWRNVIETDFNFIMQFWDCPKPTISAVQGHCLAGGLELAVACDITVADDTAIFGEPEVKFGSSIVALILPWLIGVKQAKQMLFTGADQIPAQRAYEMGLINEVVAPGTHLDRSMEIAAAIANSASLSVRMTKQAIHRSMDLRGMRHALLGAVDTAVLIESSCGPERTEFNRIRSSDGLKAAIAWRNARHA